MPMSAVWVPDRPFVIDKTAPSSGGALRLTIGRSAVRDGPGCAAAMPPKAAIGLFIAKPVMVNEIGPHFSSEK
jgi:hypothetical protein